LFAVDLGDFGEMDFAVDLRRFMARVLFGWENFE
jgi:hypothetical protein